MGQIFKELARRTVKSNCDLFTDRFVVELNVGEGIHIHFRNLRFEFTLEEFNQFCDVMTEAKANLE